MKTAKEMRREATATAAAWKIWLEAARLRDALREKDAEAGSLFLEYVGQDYQPREPERADFATDEDYRAAVERDERVMAAVTAVERLGKNARKTVPGYRDLDIGPLYERVTDGESLTLLRRRAAYDAAKYEAALAIVEAMARAVQASAGVGEDAEVTGCAHTASRPSHSVSSQTRRVRTRRRSTTPSRSATSRRNGPSVSRRLHTEEPVRDTG